jgi:hypothetical protein
MSDRSREQAEMLAVTKGRETLAVSKQRRHRFHMERINLKTLKEVEGKKQSSSIVLKSQRGPQLWKASRLRWILTALSKLRVLQRTQTFQAKKV